MARLRSRRGRVAGLVLGHGECGGGVRWLRCLGDGVAHDFDMVWGCVARDVAGK